MVHVGAGKFEGEDPTAMCFDISDVCPGGSSSSPSPSRVATVVMKAGALHRAREVRLHDRPPTLKATLLLLDFPLTW